jgi:taurine dioxygenase
MPNSSISVQPRTTCLGADVTGIDLSLPVADDDRQTIESAWVEHKVLFFRDQTLTPETHLAFATNFGSPQPAGFVPVLPDHPFVRHQEQPSKIKGMDIVWHTDDVFLKIPSKGSVLYALDVPEHGGDTVWVDMQAAYDELSAPWKAFLSGLTATNIPIADIMSVVRSFGADAFAQTLSKVPPISQPVIRTHPVSGRKSIFVGQLNTTAIDGMSVEESETVLKFLFKHTQSARFQTRLSWKKGTVAFWDNRATMHVGIPDFGDQHRLMHRVAIADELAPC